MSNTELYELLYSENPIDQRIGVQRLAEAPDSQFLDRLWWIHCAMRDDAEAYSESKERWYILYEDSYGALKKCVKLDTEWLRMMLHNADENTKYLQDLVYLLTTLKNSKNIWEENKEKLFSLIQGTKVRPLVGNILTFKDTEMKEWLKAQLVNPGDLVNSCAFQALWRMDADAGIDAFDIIDKTEFLFTKHWNIAPLLKIRHESILKKISTWLDECQDLPAKWDIFQENEIYVDTNCMQQILTYLENILAEDLKEKLTNIKSYIIFVLLAKMDTLEQLQCFRLYRGSNLERLIVKFIRDRLAGEIVTPDMDIRYYGLHETMEVLQKIGGSGYIEIVNIWLQSENPYFCNENGIRPAMKVADVDTFVLLENIIQQEDYWPKSDNVPLKQIRVARVLASWGKHEAVCRSFMKWGLWSSRDLCEWKIQNNISDEEIADRCLMSIERGEQTVGNILSLGQFAPKSTTRYYQPILDILKNADDEELITACLVAMEMLNADTGEAVHVIGKHLKPT